MTTTFLVVDSLPEDVILGFPWFEQQLAVIDTTRKCIYFGTEQRRTIYYLQKSDQQLPQNITFALDHVDPDYKLDFKKMLVQFQDVFIDTLRQPITRTVKHDIRLSSDKIVNIKPYSMNDRKKQILNEQVTEMLAAGVIEPSVSPYSFPPLIIETPNKKPRFCVDFRRLNEITESESSTLPKIPDTLKELGSAKVFSTLDLKSGYWQVALTD